MSKAMRDLTTQELQKLEEFFKVLLEIKTDLDSKGISLEDIEANPEEWYS